MPGVLPPNAPTARLILISGAEDTLRRTALQDLNAAIEGDPFDTQMILAGEASPEEWVASASTVPFLSERRTVIVRNLLRAGPPSDAFPTGVDPLKNLPECARLILVSDDEATTDYDRVRRLEGYRKSWESFIKKAGGLVLDFPSDPRHLKSEIQKAAEGLGKSLSDRGAELLADMTGRSLSRAYEELEKIALYVGNAPKITEADISAVALPSREWNVFKLVDSILEGQVGAALSQLSALVGSGTKAEQAAMQSILPNLSRSLRIYWQARVCLDHRLPSGRAAGNPLFPESGNFASLPEWQQNRALGMARKLNLDQLSQCLEILAATDARLKGQLPSFSAVETLERMVLEMADVVHPAGARR